MWSLSITDLMSFMILFRKETLSGTDGPVAPWASLPDDESVESERELSGESWAGALFLRLPMTLDSGYLDLEATGNFLVMALKILETPKVPQVEYSYNCLAV